MEYLKDRKTTGEILKKYREDSGLKQSELAEEFQVSGQLISQIERNERTFSEEMQKKYLSKFKFTPNEMEDIAFYEDYRSAGFRTKNHIQFLEEENAELKKIIEANSKGLKIIDFVKTLALEEFLKS